MKSLQNLLVEEQQCLFLLSLLAGMEASTADQPTPIAPMILHDGEPSLKMLLWIAQMRGSLELIVHPSEVILQ